MLTSSALKEEAKIYENVLQISYDGTVLFMRNSLVSCRSDWYSGDDMTPGSLNQPIGEGDCGWSLAISGFCFNVIPTDEKQWSYCISARPICLQQVVVR